MDPPGPPLPLPLPQLPWGGVRGGLVRQNLSCISGTGGTVALDKICQELNSMKPQPARGLVCTANSWAVRRGSLSTVFCTPNQAIKPYPSSHRSHLLVHSPCRRRVRKVGPGHTFVSSSCLPLCLTFALTSFPGAADLRRVNFAPQPLHSLQAPPVYRGNILMNLTHQRGGGKPGNFRDRGHPPPWGGGPAHGGSLAPRGANEDPGV